MNAPGKKCTKCRGIVEIPELQGPELCDSCAESGAPGQVLVPADELRDDFAETLTRNLRILAASEGIGVEGERLVLVSDVEKMLHAAAANIAQGLQGRVRR